MQTDKKKKNVLIFSRDTVDKLVTVANHKEDNSITLTNMLEDHEKNYILAGFLMYLIFDEIENNIKKLEGSQISGTEGIWDVSDEFWL